MAVIRAWGLMVMNEEEEKLTYKVSYLEDWNLVIPGKVMWIRKSGVKFYVWEFIGWENDYCTFPMIPVVGFSLDLCGL